VEQFIAMICIKQKVVPDLAPLNRNEWWVPLSLHEYPEGDLSQTRVSFMGGSEYE